MPNWCDNELVVMGPLNDLVEFARNARRHQEEEVRIEPSDTDEKITEKLFNSLDGENKFKEALTFTAFVPVPEDMIKDGWYDFCVKNWGTKWDASEPSMEMTQRSIRYRFFTAWGPPLPVIYKMSEMFPNLRFTLRYYEGGMGFQGKLKLHKIRGIAEFKEEDYKGRRGG